MLFSIIYEKQLSNVQDLPDKLKKCLTTLFIPLGAIKCSDSLSLGAPCISPGKGFNTPACVKSSKYLTEIGIPC